MDLSRYIWYALQRGADKRGEVKSIRYKPSPLVQGGLEIPGIEVTAKWKKTAMGILHKKVEEAELSSRAEAVNLDHHKGTI